MTANQACFARVRVWGWPVKGLTAQDVQRFRFQLMGFDVTVDGPTELIGAMEAVFGSESPEPPAWLTKWHQEAQQCLSDLLIYGKGHLQLPDFSHEKSLIATAIQEQQR